MNRLKEETSKIQGSLVTIEGEATRLREEVASLQRSLIVAEEDANKQ